VETNSKVFVAGHRGLVGSAIVRRLQADGFSRLLVRGRDELDLTDRAAVVRFFESERPDYVFLAAAEVGGILANERHPADMIRDNLLIQTNVIDAAWRHGARKLLFLGSSCIYPKFAEQPIREDSLLTGALEPTNDAYAVAKIAGVTMCQAYRRQHGFNAIAVMPTNLYGPHDNFDPLTSHVLPALIRKFHEAKLSGAKTVTIWGSGTPRREFLHVDDLAGACLFLMQRYESGEILNVGAGKDMTIAELAHLVGEVVGYGGELAFDSAKPDGTPRKLLDVSRLTAMGWTPRIALREGVAMTYRWYLDHADGKKATTVAQPARATR
jgi:GDP-L-fucose synthase